jgi:hypothetical protein
MTDFFDVNQNTADALNQGMAIGGTIELPFTAPFFYWMNGNQQMRAMQQQVPPLYYGGWAADGEMFETAIEENGDVAGVEMFAADMTSKNGKQYLAYTTRLLVLAPISYRSCWMLGDGPATTRFSEYTKGARHHVQLLALLAKKTATAYEPWGPVVLSAKGYQAQNLLSAAKDWDKELSKVRKEHAPKVPAWGFWMGVGTFGAEIKVEMVGQGSAKSPITPLRLGTFKEYNLDLLKKFFVGKAALDSMADYLAQSQEWLGAWKKNNVPATNGNGPAAPGPYSEPPMPEEPPDDQIPF